MLSLFILEIDATYHLAGWDSVFDVFIIDDLNMVSFFNKSDVPFIAGHGYIELRYDFSTPPIVERTITRRSIKNFNEASYLSALNSHIFLRDAALSFSQLTAHEINDLTNGVQDAIITVFDAHAPFRTFTVRRPATPWLTELLKVRIREKMPCTSARSVQALFWVMRFSGNSETSSQLILRLRKTNTV